MKQQSVSDAVIRRLPRYYRQLEMLAAQGAERVSSSELAAQLGLNPSQVRQDFNCFGGFGQQGYGYHVPTLFNAISGILCANKRYSAVVAGAGSLGQALGKYEGFVQRGFHIEAFFDIDARLVGKEISGKRVYHHDELADFIRANNTDIGIIAVPHAAAQETADAMVEAGVRGIWSFVPADIKARVPIQHVHLIESLLMLSYAMGTDKKQG